MFYERFDRLFSGRVRQLYELGIDRETIVRELKISGLTFDRWMEGESMPHKFGRPSVFQVLDGLTNGV